MGYPQIQTIGQPGARKAGKARAEWNAFQAKLLAACLALRVNLVIATTGVRTGKTGVQAAFHRFKAKANPGVTGIWLVESFKWFKRVALPVCKQLFGHEAVWHGTDHTWTWPRYDNAQVVVCTYVALQSMQGVTAGWGSIDEYQNMGRDAFEELEQRISDKRCKPMVLITGLPEFGSWADGLATEQNAISYEEQRAAEKAGEETSGCVLFDNVPTAVNAANIHKGYLKRMADRLSPEDYAKRIGGQKPMPRGRVFKDWAPQLYDPQAPLQGGNLTNHKVQRSLRTVLDIDFGVRRLACIASQVDALRDVEVMFAEHNLDDSNTVALCEELHKHYCVRPAAHLPENAGKQPLDAIYCDPAGNNPGTAEGLTDIRVLRAAFAGIPVKYTYSARLRRIPAGVKICNARILSQSGKRRTLMTVAMWEAGLKDTRDGEGYTKDKRGRSMALTFLRTKYPEDATGRPLSETPVGCAIDDHCADAHRYGQINRHGQPAATMLAAA